MARTRLHRRTVRGAAAVLGIASAAIVTLSGCSTVREAAPAASGRRLDASAPERQAKPFDKPAEAQQFYLKKRLPEGETALSPARYLPAKAQMESMARYSSKLGRFLTESESRNFALGTWEELGPGNIGGRTRRMVIDPGAPGTMYAGAVAGGVWKTTDGGNSWAPLDDLMANLAVASLAMDPGNSNVLYAGTGEGFFNGDAVRGAGIFMTDDAGATWSQIAATNTSDFHYVMDVVVSPNSSDRIYAATRTGVFRTLNGGTSWTKVRDGVSVNGCTDLVIKSNGPADTVFAACGTFAQATIYRNTDAGGAGSWDAVYTEANMGRTHLALAPSNENTIYAISASNAAGTFQYGLLAVFRSTSNGDSGTWTTRNRNNDAVVGNRLLLTNAPYALCVGPYYNQGWYDNVIAVDPADENIVWVGGIDLFRSNDGGDNWKIASLWYADPAADSMYNHADQHDIVFHPDYDGSSNKILFVANDGGIHKTLDARAAVDDITDTKICDTSTSTIGVVWDERNNGYNVTQFYHGTPYPDGATYFGGTQDNGTIRGNDIDGEEAWASIQGGDGGYTAVDPGDTDILFAEYTGLSIQKSIDGGAIFADAITGITDSGFAFIAPFTMDPGNAQRLWTGGYYIWRTTNQATGWTRASAITAGNDSVSALAVSATDGNRVIVGMGDGYIHWNHSALTATNVTNWAQTRPSTGYVSHLEFDPANSNIAYATYSTFGGTHVWKSTNGGQTWSALNGTGAGALPDIPVHSIAINPNNTQQLYLGTDLGVFVSVDGGLHWAVENTGFANVAVESLRMLGGVKPPTLFAFTHGRSAWRTPVDSDALFADGFESGGTTLWSSTS